MNKNPGINVDIENARLKELVEEQLAALGLESCPKEENADFRLEEKNINVPVRLGELSDLVRYHLSGRERWAGRETAYDLGLFWLETNENILLHKGSGEELHLTDKEKFLLETLYNSTGRKMLRESILETVWGYIEGTETHTLETHLYRLRQKLEPYGAGSLIEADGSGHYKLNIVE